jgi:hypothetical protein
MIANCTTEQEQVRTQTGGCKSRTHFFEHESIGQDADLILVSTNEDLISARNLTVGDSARHWGRHMSDTSLQQLSRDRVDGASTELAVEHAQRRGSVNSKGFGQRY